MKLTTRLEGLGPLIDIIRTTSGIPGLSLGVLHNGDVTHYANYGYRDVSASIPPNEDTVYVVASLSKALSSAMIGVLADQQILDWDTQVRQIITEYQRDETDSACNATISDILSHRTGLVGPDGYWMLSEGEVAFPRDQFVPVLNSLPTVEPTRTAFIYNNMAYELIGQVIEKVSGTTFGKFLNETIMKPLGMTRTFDTHIPPDTENMAKPYASLLNRSAFELPMPLMRDDGLFSSAGGMRTSVSDLLKFYHALMDAGMSQLDNTELRVINNPLKQVTEIWTDMISLRFPTLREHSYALGWVRAQLPSSFGIDGPQPWKPVVGGKAPGRLALYHQGIIQGFTSFSVLIPETRSAIVVLNNAGGLNEGGMLIASAVLDTILGEEIDQHAYKDLAEAAYEAAASGTKDIMQSLKDDKKINSPARPRDDYVGRYYNSLGNFFIDIKTDDEHELVISFMGNDADTFPLETYDSDQFFWYVTYDECVIRSRMPVLMADYYIIKFAFDENSTVLYWKYDYYYPGDGEPFRKNESDILSNSADIRWDLR
ncbi:beta-lactamase/transpeptidase-like protein [Aspergillus oleicola]